MEAQEMGLDRPLDNDETGKVAKEIFGPTK